MRIIGVTDLHDRILNFDKLLRYKPDVILLSGDIVTRSVVKSANQNDLCDIVQNGSYNFV